MNMAARVFAFFLIPLLIICDCKALLVGSNTLVSIPSHTTFPESEIISENEMRGFAWFQNGFSLENANTQVKFTSVFPISGVVDMNGGTLRLEEDLTFSSPLDIQGFGSVDGQAHALHFPPQFITLPSDAKNIEDTFIILSNDIKLSSTLSFIGTTTIKGDGHTIFLGSAGGIEITSGATLTLENVDIKDVGNGNLICASDTSRLFLDDANLFIESPVYFNKGSICIQDYVNFYGSTQFIYDSARTSTITEFATWHIHDDMQFNVGRKSAITGANPLWFENKWAQLRFSNCSLYIRQYGFQITRGSVTYDDEVTIETAGTNYDAGLVIGNGNINDDPIIEFDAGASVHLASSYVTFNSGSPDIIKTGAHKGARLTRNLGSNVKVQQTIALPSMMMEVLSYTTPPMVINSGKTLEYKNTLLVMPNAEFDVTSGRRDQSAFLLNGADSIFFSKGTLLMNVDVESTDNIVMGNGNIAGNITFKDQYAHLISELDGEFNGGVSFNSGTLELADDLRFGVNIALTGTGTINLQEHCLHLPPTDMIWTSSITWIANEACIDLQSKVSLASTWTCNGDLVINGNGNVLDLSKGGTITVASGSTLTFKNVRIQAIAGKNILLQDDTSSLVLDGVLWIQSGDYLFDKGKLNILHEVTMAGQHVFMYDSCQTSTIISHSSWIFNDHATLTIGKKKTTDLEPLYFENSSSKLLIDNAKLHIQKQGLTFTNGTLLLNHEVDLDIDSTSTANGMVMGTNTAGNDFTLAMDANATLRFNTGHLIYNNSGATGVVASGDLSARIVRQPTSQIMVNTNMTLSNFANEVIGTADPMIFKAGKALTIKNMLVRINGASFIIDNLSKSGVMHFMKGDATVVVERASALPLPLFVTNTNNLVKGSGALAGPIFLQAATAQLTFDLQGELRSAVSLGGGTLSIDSDIDFGPTAKITGQGTLDLGSQKLALSGTDYAWTATTLLVSYGGIIELNARLDLTSSTTVRGKLLIQGNGNVLHFSDKANIAIEDGAELIFRDVRLEDIAERHITSLGSKSKVTLNDCAIVLGGDLTLDEGSVEIVNKVDVVGNHVFCYDSTQTSTIRKNSELHVSDHVQLRLGKTVPGSDEIIHFEDDTAVLTLDNCTFFITSSGLQFSDGTIRIVRDVAIDVNSTSTANGLVLGNNRMDDTLVFEMSPGSTARFLRGHTVYNVARPDAIVSRSPTARLIRDNDSVFYINNNINLASITLDHSADTVTVIAPGKSITYDATTFVAPGLELKVTGIQTIPLVTTLAGDGELFLTSGSLPAPVIIAGTNNAILGTGNMLGQVILTDAQSQLKWNLNGVMGNAIALNGGSLVLEQDMKLSRGIIFTSTGIINIQDNSFMIGTQPLTWPTDIYFDGQNGEVVLGADITLSSKWTFSGNCTLNGQGKTVDFDEGHLEIEDGSSLTLKNITLKNIATDTVHCNDDAGIINMDDVLWLQDGLFTFSHGAMLWHNEVAMVGTGTFAYQTCCTSTIALRSELSLDSNFTFTYDPILSTSKDLFAFEDDSSSLSLNNASFYTNSNGIVFKTGSIKISGDCRFAAHTITDHGNIIKDEGIALGDHSISGDIRVQIAPGGICRLTEGSIMYRNTQDSGVTFSNEIATFILMPHTRLKLEETLDIGIGRLKISKDAVLEVVSGKEILGPLFSLE